ncbi:MAG: alkaline phosphatase family protein [bacterium]|nr:alkaline phosphatase family protein [bacterium]
MGFDGVDPGWMNRWMAEGKLPNLAKLKSAGSYHELKSTIPPQSPVAWASFATGTNPGGHGIYDFVKRTPADYMPEVAVMDLQPPKLLLNMIPTEKPYGKPTRGGMSFWKVAAGKGIHSTLLTIPYTFPPEDVAPGRMLSGLGTPDLRGTNSTFTYMATDLGSDELAQSIGGGKLQKVSKINNEIATFIEGMNNPAKNEERLSVPLNFSIRDDQSVEVRLEGISTIIQPGSWSEWMPFHFKITPFLKATGICRFYLFTSTPEFRLYMTPLCIDPSDPYIPLSYPEGFSRELCEKVGYFKTVGWLYDTSALNEDRLGDAQWIEDMNKLTAEQERIFYSELDRRDWDLFIGVFTDTDRSAHMFYRYLDPEHPLYDPVKAAQYGDIIESTYRHMDRFVGEIMDKYLDDQTTLIVMSDHGFHSFRRGFNTNTWLAENGFLNFQGMEKLLPGQQIPREIFPKGEFFPRVVWNKTKAYSLGTGQIYINLSGRESRGIVRPGAEYNALLDQIVQGLMTVTDPMNGTPVFKNVYKAKDVYSGEFADKAPDLQLGFADGYRTSSETMLGGIPAELVTSNLRNWSGDHSASAVEETSGIIYCSRPMTKEDPAIVDIAPTVLGYFGIEKLPVMEGSSILNP